MCVGDDGYGSHGNVGQKHMIAVLFDPKTNEVQATVVSDDEPSLMANVHANLGDKALLYLPGLLISAPDLHALVAINDAVNPSGKLARDVALEEAQKAQAAIDAVGLEQMRVDASARIDVLLADKDTPPEKVAELQKAQADAVAALDAMAVALGDKAPGYDPPVKG